MNYISEIKVEYTRHENSRGTREWGEFKITSTKMLNDEFVFAIVRQYGFGDSKKFETSMDGHDYVYSGKYDRGD